MTLKKRESWWFWTIPVNISAIALFSRTETWAFVFLYVVFLANSVWGWIQWQRAEAVGASQPAT
jgi:nicotinamide riboside transporter PnuC